MKRTLFLIPALFALQPAFGADAPRGSLLELHSCEVYAGGCVVSSEAQQGGRYMLRAWDFNGGSFAGTDFRGLQVAVLQLSPDNLAADGSSSGRAVLYLPDSASPSQRAALLGWLKSTQPDFHPEQTLTRAVPLDLKKTAEGYTLKAGDSISVETTPMERCESFTCGEALWYQPRSRASIFTVAVDRASTVQEPLLQLKWEDHGKRNAFIARFGDSESAKGRFVTMAEVCGGTGAAF